MNQRIVFMGTPDFAVPSLDVLARRLSREHLLVVTQPDKAAGRGRKMQAPPVKRAAEGPGLDVEQVGTLRDSAVRERLESFGPDLVMVAAFGLILPGWVLALPRLGCVNLHASDLPRFRGASPVAAAIEMGDEHTAVALMQMERGLDTGDVFARERVEIEGTDTTESLTATLSRRGARLLDEHLEALLDGSLSPVPQSGKVLETRKLLKAHGVVDWQASALDVERHVRAMWSWPRAWTVGDGDVRIQVHAAEVVEGGSQGSQPGVVTGHDHGVLVGTGNGVVRLRTVQLPGKTAQPASELTQHPAFTIGATLGTLGKGDRFVDPDPWIVEAGEV